MRRSRRRLGILLMAIGAGAAFGCSSIESSGPETPRQFVRRLEDAVYRDPLPIPISQFARYYYVWKSPEGLQAEAVWIGPAALRLKPGLYFVSSEEKLPSIVTHAGCGGSVYITARLHSYDLVCDADRPIPPPPPQPFVPLKDPTTKQGEM